MAKITLNTLIEALFVRLRQKIGATDDASANVREAYWSLGRVVSATTSGPKRTLRYNPAIGPSMGARAALAAGSALISSAVQAQDSYSDPAGSGVLVSAVSWLQGTMLGTVATVAAVVAVAAVGFMMLTGRINWRYGITVIVGCFILFGASSIVAGIHSTAMLGQ